MESWNAVTRAQEFLRKANAIHPEEIDGEERYNEALATQNVYYECYMSSFEKSKLIELLRTFVAGKFETPEEANAHYYQRAYVKTSQKLLEELS